MDKLMRSVSGIRGVVGSTLTPITLLEYLNAYLQLTKAKKIVLGRDSRPTGPLIEDLIASGCAAAGVEVIKLGLATTPTVEWMVPLLGADGGIIVTASHNPIEWNALKFLDHEGLFLRGHQVEELFKLVDSKSFSWVRYDKIASSHSESGADASHIQGVLKLPYINCPQIIEKKFKVVYDGVNGAGSHIVPDLLRQLGCQVVSIHITPDGQFPRGAEPTPENLSILGDVVRREGAAVGFATDPDGDRLALVDEKGKPLGEEYTLALAAELVLQKKKGPVTINLSTSRMLEDIAANHGVPCYRAKVGEINVTEQMQKNGSVIGGEGNGGVILPDLHYGRDGVLGAAMILQLMAQSGRSLSALAADIPAYTMVKSKVPVVGKSLEAIYTKVLGKFKDAKINRDDGLHLSFAKSWVHIRASNTEPIIRVIAEAPTEKEARNLCEMVASEV